ncbi:midasin isoform X2 [Agrilus planipennis]|uniref:Midasin n=1 Tax=Agrilus planipennis TaxID=224129 RepID=A0A7F5R948_AGRPL|nr:midasin isoform X2 [Agrilus planipennis]
MSERIFVSSLIMNLQNSSNDNVELKRIAEKTYNKKLNKSHVKAIYNDLALLMLNPVHAEDIVVTFKEHVVSILSYALHDSILQWDTDIHLRNCVVLGKIIDLHPDVGSVAISYFNLYPSPFESNTLESPIKKKTRTKESPVNREIKVNNVDIVDACYKLLKFSPDFFGRKWPWSVFFKTFFNQNNPKIIWNCCCCVRILTGMNESSLEKFMKLDLSDKQIDQFLIQFETNKHSKSTIHFPKNEMGTADEDFFIDQSSTIFSHVTYVGNILLPVYNKETIGEVTSSRIIEVESTKRNLFKIALAVAANKPVCLQGPVGSGKTSLVEYVAMKTGRILGKSLFKIQLGDQTDSKLLLGSYRCTDVPGEFVWQPGVLTQAVIQGSWILLEDIDLANLDISSVISALIENKCLSVPGYRDAIPVGPGFQIFLTQRSITKSSGHHMKQTNTSILLEKHILRINIESLFKEELEQIISTSYPVLKTISSRMVNVFRVFSAENYESFSRIKGGRLISTRDLFKWCSRAAINFDVSSQASALKVLQEAIDIFCCSYSKLEEKIEIAKAISSELGIVNEKGEYFCTKYKPNLTLTPDSFTAGRVSLPRNANLEPKYSVFSFTRPSVCLLEQIMCCISMNEPVLLVGETGTGKTTSVQYLARVLGKKLVVINMNQQSDSVDLLGGYKPVDLKFVLSPLLREFRNVFCNYFNVEKNQKFLSNINLCFNEQKWDMLLKLLKRSCEAALVRLSSCDDISVKIGGKRKKDEKRVYSNFLKKWTEISKKLEKFELQLKNKNALVFSFVEGSLVRAVEEGYWVLLDEINLANAETLECLSGLLESREGSLSLLERGDKEPIKRHKDFVLFACMNPSTDVGKKDLPVGLRNRFTEFFVDELTDKSDLLLLVSNYLNAMALSNEKLENIVKLYLSICKEAQLNLTDGLGHKPHFSLRSLCRALVIASKNPCGVFTRSLFESFLLSFLTQLDVKSYRIVQNLILKYIFGNAKEAKSILNQPIPPPQQPKNKDFVLFEGYWIAKGDLEPLPIENYVLTESVRRNLKDLARVVSLGRLPVLLQGVTSVGKTSMITYLAKKSGNKCVRINNHEHTDLQEYIGSYVANSEGKLVFREGVLVEAMRKGHWIILDELNLAPTDVLEALNRVLDDNRELFIPETQTTVKANPNFMLFATQNPPGVYGGRKMLSRAFRNRFVELHFDEIPPVELEVILHERCEMPMSYAIKMVAVMTDLQTRRRRSAAFAGKQGFITLRDLFRWGERYRLSKVSNRLYDWDQHLADEGYLLLAGRVRQIEEREEIAAVIENRMKRKIVPENLFTLSERTSPVTKGILENLERNKNKHRNIVWTYNMRQLAVLVWKALDFHEPVLLVGETGCGKTTICQLLAELRGQELLTVNCHMHTESSDFIGGLRPIRDRNENNNSRLFEWVDGPLIEAVVGGEMFLADEISLADDSVLERLNSLLESERTLLVAEKGTDINSINSCEFIVANDNFRFIGTMNPGGDYGKKELSPALRNRFTEIWCEPCKDRADLIRIIECNIKDTLSLCNFEDEKSGIGKMIMDFIEFFSRTELGRRLTITVRDILTWVCFLNACDQKLNVTDAFVHGAFLTFLDGMGSGLTTTESPQLLTTVRESCLQFLKKQLRDVGQDVSDLFLDNEKLLKIEYTLDGTFGIKPFYVALGNVEQETSSFCFDSSTTKFNAVRLLRGMQLNKAILLEGSPGVGKTSLVMALAKCTKNRITRINLSDQTDISDLFGADLPVEEGTGGHFSWRDGPFLRALKNGDWILLDELNLASQSVLEGLNACLDHRGEIFIPELGKTFTVKLGTRLFACQNPQRQGGSRRGLPRSFLNRFTQVYIHAYNDNDYERILSKAFPLFPQDLIRKMIAFNSAVNEALRTRSFGHRGAPWEFNLRDLVRWCEVTQFLYKDVDGELAPERFVNVIYADRMRTHEDKMKMCEMFAKVFGRELIGIAPIAYVTRTKVYIGDARVEKMTDSVNMNVLKQEKTNLVLRKQLSVLRSLCYCVNLKWMAVLVGPAASGKSKVVHTLAKLTGRTLYTLPVTPAMDTIDLLGGFEQTDFSRHLEEITKQTEYLVLNVIQKLFIKGNKENAVKLLFEWENCISYLHKEANEQTMTEVSKLFLAKIESLKMLWNDLINFGQLDADCFSLIEKLQNRGKFLGDTVNAEGNLNAGGKFEWVDSVLVKCLQNGYWLLIDDVNLCNAAVLDRLNAVLEPNGVLTIGEKGVDKNGEPVQIKPHKDFRLFLTLDPRNGEISRAMRNRGLEIYMLNDDEMNELDLKSLISLEGLKHKDVVEALINVHYFIKELIIGDKPDVRHILQSAFLISQQISRGIALERAFVRSILDVYFKTRNIAAFNTNDPEVVIITKIKSVLENLTDSPLLHTTLSTKDLEISSDLEKIRQQVSILESHLPSKPHANVDDYNRKLIQWLLIHSYSISNKHDIKLRWKYVDELLKGANAKTYQTCNDLIRDEILRIVEMENNNDDNDIPIDTGWLLDNIYLQNDPNSRNRLLLRLHFMSTKYLYERKGEWRKENMTLLQYMTSVREEKQKNNIDDVVVENFFTLLDEYDAFILEKLKNKNLVISDFDTVAALALLQWRFAFYQNTKINIQGINITAMKTLLSDLHLHYKWFFKFSVGLISKILKETPDPSLQRLIDTIGSQLSTHFSLAYKIGRLYAKKSATPTPFVNENQIKNNLIYEEEMKKVDLYKGRSNFNVIVKKNATDTNRRNNLIEIKFMLKCGQENIDFHPLNQATTVPDEENVLKDSGVQILPVLDYVCSLAMLSIKWQRDLTKVDENFLKNSKTVPADLAGLLLAYDKMREPSFLYEIKTKLFWYQIKSPSSVPKRYTYFNVHQSASSNDTTPTVVLPMHTPRLVYLTVDLLITDSNPTNIFNTITLGTYRENEDLLETFKSVLWKNTRQLSYNDYDFITCEIKYLLNEYNNVMTVLLKALTNDSKTSSASSNHFETTEMCLSEIKRFEMKYPTHKADLKLLKYLIDKCLNEIKKLDGSIESNSLHANLNRISNVYLVLNNIKICVYSKLPAVDHLTKVKFKKQRLSQIINELEILNRSFEFENCVYSDDRRSLHPLHFHVDRKINELQLENEKYEKFVTVRPENISYQLILKEISHINATILSQQKLDNFYSESDKYFTLLSSAIEHDKVIDDGLSEEQIQKFINISQNNIKTYENAIEDVLERYRIGFPDVIEPFLSTVTEYLYGYILKVGILKKMLLQYKASKQKINLHKLVTNFVQFPSIPNNYHQLLRMINVCSNVFKIFLKHNTEDEIENISKTEKSRLVFIAIQEVYNLNVIISKNTEKLENKLFKHFDCLIELFVGAWTKQKDLEEARKKEKEALYKIRIKTEDEIDQEEFSQLFPNYRDVDFSDLDSNGLEEGNEKFENNEEDILAFGEITKEDAKYIMDLHGQLVHNFTKTEWLDCEKATNVPLDIVGPLLKKFKIFKLILDESISSADYHLDAQAIGSLNVLVDVAQKFGRTDFEQNSSKLAQKKRNNFYKDSNTDEVKNSYHILKELENEIDRLLNEWQDHPGLLTIKSVIERIYEFPITSPLSRFLTGFEMLLTKCHEWEQNAHSGVSLSANIQNLVQQIIAWRKIEMNMWKESLNGVYERMNEPITNWWFYMYNVSKQFIYEGCLDKKELIETLRKFIFESNLAEFNGRLGLLYTFHCHAVHLEKNDTRDQLVNILWNIYQYFKQYEPIVENKIKDLRSPIEKKLKDYIKIVKWKDISYWAIKETCEKSHKTLFKHMKEFEKALNSPVKLCLSNVTSQIKNEENVGIWDRPQRQVPKNYHYTIDSSNYVAKYAISKKISSDEAHSKLDKYFLKSRTFCKEVIDSCQYPILIKALDCFIAEIIERSTHLQNIQVDSSLPKTKQKSSLKSILQQKRKALSDLFKNLTKIGFSYKTGLVIETTSNDLDDYLLMKPIDLSAGLKQFPQSHYNEKITTIWEGCETYYIRSLIRLNLLKNILSKPASDLGAQNVERCRGFATHLVQSIQKQKAKVIDSFEILYNIRKCKIHLTDICEQNTIFQTHMLEKLKDCLSNVVITMEQYKIYLLTAPEQPVFDSNLKLNIPVLMPEPIDYIHYKHDQCWDKAMCLVQEAKDKAQKLLSSLKHYDNSDFKLFALHDTEEIVFEFTTIVDKIVNLSSIIGNTPLADALKHLKAEIRSVSNQLVINANNLLKVKEIVTPDEFRKTIKNLEDHVLLSIQNIYKKYEEDIQKEKNKSLENTDEDLALNDNHLKMLILQKLDDDIELINMKNILTDIHKIISNINTMDSKTILEIKTDLSKTFPLLEQLLLFYQYFVTQQVLTYRITSKLTSIILNIFIDLLTKGFCSPSDLPNEETNEAEGECQKGGFGLSEDQGEKDVSERIESEDQLDDAKSFGEEKEKQDNQPNKEEEKGIEMSEDFDADLQDVQKDKEDEENSNNGSDAEEQMGDVDKGTDRLDQQLWGSDEENDTKDETKEDIDGGGGEKLGEEQIGTETAEEDSTENKKQKLKDIDNFKEPEIDDDQIDPHHGNHPEYPEPEALDLPDDFGLDKDDNEKEEAPEENPFDIDTIKDQIPLKDTLESNDQQDDEKEKSNLEDEKGESEEENGIIEEEEEEGEREKDDQLGSEELEEDDKNKKTDKDNSSDIESSEMKDEDASVKSGLDQNQSTNEKTQPMEIDNSETSDNAQTTDMKAVAEFQENRDSFMEEESEDKEGIGQSQTEKSKTGHKTPANAFEDISNSKQDESKEERKRKPGEADSERSLGDVKEPVKKKLKTFNIQNSNESLKEENEDDRSYEQQTEMYKHIKETTKTAVQTLDFATDEQIQQQQEEISKLKEEEINENILTDTTKLVKDDEEEEIDILNQIEKCQGEQTEFDGKKDINTNKKSEGGVREEVSEINIEGDIVETHTASRAAETIYCTQDALFTLTESHLNNEEIAKIRIEVENQLSAWNEIRSDVEAERVWEKISSVTTPLAQILCEQLRLILEPTQASQLKGDYRTGKRINMMKVIPYIASQFRKDKIWLRRTKPSKRDYQIVLAIDDSSSMCDNRSKELAFESVSLISKALTLLESGQLSILGFGENVEILHKLGDTFSEKNGSNLIQKFTFSQKKTCIAKLVNFTTEMMTVNPSTSSAQVARLLIIVSDGRGIFWEGENQVQQAVRRAKLADIFMIFVIIDNPQNKDSILDIRMPIFNEGKLLGIKSYMDSFPFPFYIILKDINSLPDVLSEALRQWFEIVINNSKI